MNKQLTVAESEKLLNLPGEFIIKIVGVNDPRLVEEVIKILSFHVTEFDASNIQSKLSQNGNYVSLNAKIWAVSKAHLDAIYLALNNHELIRITL